MSSSSDFILPDHRPALIRARHIYTFAGEKPTCGKDLLTNLEKLENHAILCRNGMIEAIGKNIPPPFDCEIHDFEDAAILPAFSNCHTHIQLSSLKNKTRFGEGFTPWLKSLVPHVLEFAKTGLNQQTALAIQSACKSLWQSGAWLIGDIGGSIKGSLEIVDKALEAHALSRALFCEHFGFQKSDTMWPSRCATSISAHPDIASKAAPAGHALYSTDPEILVKAHKACATANKTFTFHLAESPEEIELLANGSGPLAEYYRPFVLPLNWHPPNLSPLQFAKKLGILTKTTLAVHGAQLTCAEIKEFASTGAMLCLCVRSNHLIGVGFPNIKAMIENGISLCLGTDGLSSAPDLDIRNEVKFIQEKWDLPLRALWRMAIVNGAHALKRRNPVLAKDMPARFSIWPMNSFAHV